AAASRASSAENIGVTAAPVLQVPLGSRALGMGTAFTAVASDSSGLSYNPAGLARLNAHEAGLTYIAGAGESVIQHLAYAGPTPLSGISGSGYTSIGASLLFSQSGTIEINRLRSDGSLQSSQSLPAGNDLVASFGYAERVGMTPLELREASYGIDHFIGLGGKFIRSTLVQSYSASTFAGDVGYLAGSREAGWSFGASALNLGGRLKYIEQADPLPSTLRSGIAWQTGVRSIHHVVAALDGDYVLDEKVWHVNAGLEYFWLKSYGFRLGYQFHRGDAVGLTTGFGLRWKGRILFDYAWALGDSFGNAHRVTLTYRFAGVPPSVRGRQRRPFIEAAPERERMRGLEEKKPAESDIPRPRAVPRDRSQGVPGWIY
ncbi:MAG: PorV/PorQ family protein, partial [Elusimicrobiota bacterium]